MKIVSYLRVSTNKQGESGIGLEGQRRVIRNAFPNCEIITEVEEVESGFNNSRPKLRDAVKICKQNGATLVFADIDRAGRDEEFLFSILPKLGVPYRDASAPSEDPSTSVLLQFKKVMANLEGKKIQGRSQQASITRKLRGDVMGKPENFTQDVLIRSAETRKETAIQSPENIRAYAVIKLMGGRSHKEIAEFLNLNAFKTRNHCEFTHVQVKRLIELYNDK